jgi:hypothetical protein
MTPIPGPGLRYLLAAIAAFWVVGLAACAPSSQWPVGLDALALNGRWATVVEHSGDPPTWRLVLLDLQDAESIALADGVDSRPESSFSPDGSYLLFRTPDGWILRDMDTGRQVQAATREEHVQFLPDGELLLTSSDDELSEFLVVPDLALPWERSLLIDRVRYSFSTQRPTRESQLPDEEPRPVCARSAISDPAMWAIVDADGAAFVLVAGPDGVSVEDRGLSAGLATLLDRQAVIVEQTARRLLEAQVRQEAEEAREVLDEQEVEARVEEQLEEQLETYRSFLDLTLLGVLSPDGDRLLFLLAELVEQGDEDLSPVYFLYLIDLATGAEPQPLSSGTEWRPDFAFSPDGSQVLFESNREAARSLYLASSDGTDIRRVALQEALSPCWH